MPVFKVPVVHKFGIISHSQRLELQRRLFEQSRDEAIQGKLPSQHMGANPFKVSEEFVQKYNTATLLEKETLHEKAEKMLHRSKRRCGLQTLGEGEFVDLPLAWSELAVLAQCRGKVQEDCFDILCASLNQAPLHEENIPTLFFLGESTLYWLRTETMKQSYLRVAEVKLLKMGKLVFARLLFHHLSGRLRGLAEFKVRLHSYLTGIKHQHVLYSSYPGVCLCLRFIDRVGEIIIGPYTAAEQNGKENNAEISESVPALAACVFRSLCVWRSVVKNSVDLKKDIFSLLVAVHEIGSNDWLNGFLALSILGEAAKLNMKVCTTLQDIARGIKTNVTSNGTVQTVIDHFPQRKVPDTQGSEPLEFVESQFQAELDELVSDFDTTINVASEQHRTDPIRQPKPSAGRSSENIRSGSEVSESSKASRLPQAHSSKIPGIGGWGWETAYQYCTILTDICLQGCSSEIQKSALMGKWRDADVTTFRAGVTNPCIESCGLADLLEYRGPILAGNKIINAKKTDWAWMVRYGALSGMAKLTHALAGSDVRAGMRSAAWALITAVQECPTADDRVIEAIRIAHVEYAPVAISNTSMSVWRRIAEQLSEIYVVPTQPSPRNAPTSRPSTKVKTVEPTRITPSPSGIPSESVRIKRPTIREELIIHTAVNRSYPDFNTRTSLDLHRVIADQWRKDLITTQNLEEQERQKEIELKRKEEEIIEEEKLKRRREKLKGKPTANLAPYQL